MSFFNGPPNTVLNNLTANNITSNTFNSNITLPSTSGTLALTSQLPLSIAFSCTGTTSNSILIFSNTFYNTLGSASPTLSNFSTGTNNLIVFPPASHTWRCVLTASTQATTAIVIESGFSVNPPPNLLSYFTFFSGGASGGATGMIDLIFKTTDGLSSSLYLEALGATNATYTGILFITMLS